jgi:hypothetical protein
MFFFLRLDGPSSETLLDVSQDLALQEGKPVLRKADIKIKNSAFLYKRIITKLIFIV